MVCCAGLVTAGPPDWQARMREANRLDSEGKYAEAESLYLEALREAEKPAEEKSSASDHRLAESLNNLAAHYYRRGSYAQAEPLYRRALEVWKSAGPGVAKDEARTMNNLAALYRAKANYSEAEPLYLRALRLLEPDNAGVWTNLAELYRAEGNYNAAERAARKALEIFSQAAGPDSVASTAALQTLAGVCEDLGRYEEAIELLERTRRIREQAYGSGHPLLATTLANESAVFSGSAASPKPSRSPARRSRCK